MKKIWIGLGLLLLLLIAFILIKTLSFSPKEYPSQEDVIEVNANPATLGQALRFETISHKKEMIDDEAFRSLHRHLSQSFPLVDSLLQKEVVNDYSLMYHWQGTDPDLKPLVLIAHQDVVPVEYSTRDEWRYPAFSGEITDEFIYGRGTLDDKGSLIAILAAVEHLLQKGVKTQRGIYLCFGHDEEIGGEDGAKVMAQMLEERGIEAWMVLDEGGTLSRGIVPGMEKPVALIGTSEKGYLSLELSINLPGGHSSMPEERNAIGVLNKALYRLQNKPLPNRLSPPIEGFVTHVGPHLPFVQKMAFANKWLFKPMIYSAYEKTASGAALIHTTQVATIFNAGVKDNIVPTRASAVVNYRLLPGDSPQEILQRAREIVSDTAVRVVIHEDLAVDPSLVSDYNTEQFSYLAGAIKGVNPEAVVSPYLVLGATDARHFYRISDQVYRFSPIPLTKSDLPRIHGLNERVTIEGYQKAVDFYATLINGL